VAGEPGNGVPSLVGGSPKASRRAYPGEFGGCLPRNVVSPKGRVWPRFPDSYLGQGNRGRCLPVRASNSACDALAMALFHITLACHAAENVVLHGVD
jgi:hypothetical protein